MLTEIKQATPKMAAGTLALWQEYKSNAKLWALAGTTLCLVWAYWPNLVELRQTWDREPNYSHGYLVIPFALWLVWLRLSETKTESPAPAVWAPWLGWVFLIPVLALRSWAYESDSESFEKATILPAIVCLVWTFGGWPLLRRIWPAIAFLVFMLPLPVAVNDLVVMPLQTIAATGSSVLLQLSAIWVIQEGNVLHLRTLHGMAPLNVAEACSGLRMLMTMAATITATIILIALPVWKRITLLLSVVPIALLSNMIRIVATGWFYYYLPPATDLQLLTSVKQVQDIQAAGQNLLVVADVGHVLHFRVFDHEGKMVLDTDEQKLAGKAGEIAALRQRITTPPRAPGKAKNEPPELSSSEREHVIAEVSSITGQKLTSHSAKDRAHDWSGYLMMPLALTLVLLELGILGWLVPPDDEPDDAAWKAGRPMLPKPSGKRRIENTEVKSSKKPQQPPGIPQ